jgi:hypothetical protein
MPDLVSVAAFITSIKNATDIAKALKDADFSLEKAEMKLKVAELISSLADARIQAAEVQEIIQEKDKLISELEKAFELKKQLIRSKEGYYEIGDDGKPTGDPYCSFCWENKHITIHLHTDLMNHKTCANCKTHYM